MIALWVAFGAGVVGTSGVATVAAWVVKDLSVMCYNAVFPMIEDDLNKFEKWAKEQNMNTKEIANKLEDGKVPEKGGNSKNSDNGGEEKQNQDQS